MSSTTSPARVPGLDLLRALAIGWVLLFHARVMQLGRPLDPASRFGWLGVDLFFALSGYLIGAQWLTGLSRPGAFGAFYGRRLFRIVPAYAVTLAVYLLAPSLREAANLMPTWQYLTFTENLFIDFSVPRAFTHVWSLCVEEHFYLLFPLLSLVVARLAPRATTPLLLALVLGGALARGWVWEHRVLTAAEPDVAYYEQLYYPTWARLDPLLAGLALALVKVFRPSWFEALTRRRWTLGALAGACLGVACWLFDGGPTAAAVVVGFPLIALGMGALVASATRWRLRVPLAGALASGAYSLYLSHKLAFAFVRERWGASLREQPSLAFVVYAAAALGVGAALYWLVERPFLRLRDRRPAILAAFQRVPAPSKLGAGLADPE